MNPEIPIPPKHPSPILVAVIILLGLGVISVVYYFSQIKSSENTPATAQSAGNPSTAQPIPPPSLAQPASSPLPTVTINNRVLAVKDGFLTIKDNGKEVKVKVLSDTVAIKQFRIGSSGIGTRVEKIKPGDFIYLTATKSADGELFMNSAVILLEEFASPSATKK